MANELQKVGLVFKEEGAIDFKKTLQEINLEMNKNYNQFRLTQSQWDSSTSSTEKLRAQQEYLTNALAIQQDKVTVLKKELSELENAENKNTIAIKKKRNELVNAELKLKDYENRINDIDVALNDNSKKMQNYAKKINDVSEKISDVGNKASVISAGVAAGGVALATNAMNLENAVAKYVSSTNTAENETEKYKQVLENINNNNYGEGYEDIADSMAQVTMQLKDLNEQDLQNITEKAIALRDLFGYDVSESIRAVKAMMDNLNVSADEAFNLIAEGKKQGLDFSNELLDNINEYSVQFGKLGLSAEDMFNIFKVGADNGAFNLDKIGDAVKEFSIRVIDGSNTTVDGFKRIGLNADEMTKKFANGGEEAKQAFIEVVNRLGSMDDKVSQSIAGVDLFGTMWEDLGPTVITSFSKMDNGISKSSDSMQKSIDQLYNTTKKKAEAQLKRLQSLGADFGEEMLPVLEDLIDMAEGFVDKLNDMSDAEKENIVKIGLFVAALGPVIKTAGTAGQVIGGVTQGIGTFTQAIGVATGKTTSSVASVNNLANVFTKITSPIGLATLAITATTGALTYLALKQTEEQKIAKDLSKEMAEQKQEIEAYNQSIDNTTNANLAQINSVSKLKDELGSLVDENGRVKEGYESRVSFILNQLNEALGTEYELNGNIVKSYQDLQNEIDNTIEKQRAKIILNGEEEKYTEAIQKQGEAVENLKQIQDQLGMTIDEAKQKYSELYNALDSYYKNPAQSEYTSAEILNMTKQLDSLQNLIKGYNDAEYAVQLYTNNIKKYEDDYALYTEGKYNEIYNSIVGTTQNITNTTTQGLKQSIEEQQKNLQLYQEQVKNTGNEVSQEYANQAEQNLNQLINELYNRTTTIGELGQNEVEAWKQLATNSYDKYSEKMKQIPEETRRKIEEATGVVGSDVNLANASGEVAQKATVSFENNSDGERAGRNFVSGVKTGLANKSEVDGAVSASGSLGSKILNKFKDILGIHSPSKEAEEAAEYFLEGFVLGINENQKNALKSISNLAGNINDELNNGLDSNDYKVKTKRSSNFSYNQVSQDIIQLVNDSNQKIIDLLTQILEKSGHSIVLDTGILVGETIDKIDTELGDRQSRRERGS